jgi:putative ABC transport system ATP-binding protein
MSAKKMLAKLKDPVLELKKVSKIYHIGDQVITALNQLSLTIHEGEFVAVMGPSGSGKSTFLQVASILAMPSEGEIFLRGRNVTSYNEVESAALRNSEIGFVFQQFNLLPKTSAIEQVALPLVYAGVGEAERLERAKLMLERFELGNRLSNTPAELSGGQQQRVAIARALINNPAIIFADEPTGNLDSKSGRDVERILRELNDEGRTIIMVTHSQEAADIAKREVFIKDGEIYSDKPVKNRRLQTLAMEPKK